ncbi:MAG: HEAT repeat domain-containing protein [Spirochaetia bacterium]|nr:HEAT repeat domain-containing protein [Spirochaetia bacterium]
MNIFACLILIYPCEIYAQNLQNVASKYSPVAETDAIWNLEHGGDFHDQQIITLLEKIKNMPEKLWLNILSLAREEPHQILRNYLIVRFTVNFPYFGQSENIYQSYILLLNEETRRIMSKDQQNDEDTNRLLKILASISQWKLKEMFYPTSTLVAYPLLEVRKAANEAMINIKDDRFFPIVLKLAESSNPVERTYAIDSLFYLKDDRTLPILLQLLADKNKSVRYYVIRTLEVLNSQDAIPYYIRILRSDSSNEARILAANVLGKLKPPAAYNSLLEVLSDSDTAVRKAALLSINEYNSVNSAYFISRQLAQETDNELKILEIKTLLSLNNSGLMTGLNRILKDETDINILIWAIYVSGKLADINGYDLILEKLSHQNEKIREEAVMALAGFKYKKAIPNILLLLSNKTEKFSVQCAALYSIEMIDDASSIPDLYNLSMNHDNLLIRSRIKVVLKEMLDKRYR